MVTDIGRDSVEIGWDVEDRKWTVGIVHLDKKTHILIAQWEEKEDAEDHRDVLLKALGWSPPERFGPASRALRDLLGERVRQIWIAWAKEQPEPKASWLIPWTELSESDREVDRRIGEVLFGEGEIEGASKVASRIPDILVIAERQAASEMRERAARYVESRREESAASTDAVQVFDVLAAHIRKLPFFEEKP